MKILAALLPFLYLGLCLMETFANGSDKVCQLGWNRKPGGNCFYVSNDPMSFDEAQKQCELMNSRLFPVSSENDQTQLISLLEKKSEECKEEDDCQTVWIGVRRENLEWTSIGGELIEKQNHIWAPLYPADSGNCVVLSLQKDEEKKEKFVGYWKNKECTRPFRFVCFAKPHPKIEITSPAKCPDVTDLIKKLAKDVENSTNQVIQEVKNQMAKEAKEFGKIAKELKNIKKKVDVQLTKKLEDIRQLILKDKGETPKNTTVPPTVEKKCPLFFEYVPEINQCLSLIMAHLSWSNARVACAERGSRLLMIQDSAKQKAVRDYLQKKFASEDPGVCVNSRRAKWGNIVWIGGQTADPDKCGTQYVWKSSGSDDTPFTYTNWYKSAPNCYYTGENCALMTSSKKYDYRWEDFVCKVELCSVCEI